MLLRQTCTLLRQTFKMRQLESCRCEHTSNRTLFVCFADRLLLLSAGAARQRARWRATDGWAGPRGAASAGGAPRQQRAAAAAAVRMWSVADMKRFIFD